MTFLELCQRLREEAGISGVGPITTVNQTGIYSKIVQWVRRAYLEIQTEEQTWRWLWVKTNFPTVIGKKEYTPAELGLTEFNEWERHSFFAFRPNAQQKWPLRYMEYEPFRNFFVLDINSQPLHYSFAPNKNLLIDVEPTEVETWEFEYWRAPFRFTTDGDLPAFPSHHHDIIVYKALMYYAADQEAGEIYADARTNYLQYLARLRDSELMRPHIFETPLA